MHVDSGQGEGGLVHVGQDQGRYARRSRRHDRAGAGTGADVDDAVKFAFPRDAPKQPREAIGVRSKEDGVLGRGREGGMEEQVGPQ